jgi:phospholipid/cholesterol/gamma-HCH transport system substrate-binding protein
MEIRAHYTLIGGFVLAFALGIFGFVYWLQNTSGLGTETLYQVQFEQPVTGLTVGQGVLFNGVRVGAITALKLDAQDPKRLTATIAVSPSTPIRADTQVDVTYQGLTGAPAIALKGGSPSAQRLSTDNNHPAVLTAGAGVGQNLTESARVTLQHIDELIADNAKPIHTAIEGISAFADMLGRNSKRVEGMIGGLEKLTGSGPENAKPTVYDLSAAKDFPNIKKTIKEQMVVPDPGTIVAYDTQKILIRSGDGTFSDVQGGQWADSLPKLMQARILQSFENANQLGNVSRPSNDQPEQPPYRLELGIRNFQIVPDQQPSAVVEFSARLLDDKGKVIGARIFNASTSAKSVQAADAVVALNDAFSKTAHDLVVWTVGLL